ncbi:MAG: hypothetical protein ACI8TQ_003932 [Planctomycetota bacterium]|jgi:hypothetical protein
MQLTFALLSLLVPQVSGSEPNAPQPSRQIEISLEAGQTRLSLKELELDVIYSNREANTLTAIASDADLELLRSNGINYTVQIEDLQKWYADRSANDVKQSQEAPALGQWLTPVYGQGSMGGFYTHSEYVSVINQIRSAYPSIVSAPSSIGLSLQGRELWAMSISDNPGVSEGEPELRMDSLHHSREPMSMHALLWYMLFLVENYGTDPMATYLVDRREQWFVPMVNPDGYAYNESIAPGGGGLWRKNRRNNGDGSTGVDLNRNYDSNWGYDLIGSSTSGFDETFRGTAPGSEPEVAAMMNFIGSHNFSTVLSMHCFSNLWLRPWGYDFVVSSSEAEMAELGTLATEFNQYASTPAVDLYPANGTTIDYDHDLNGAFAYTPEIGSSADGFWPVPSRIVPLAEENLDALIRTALAASVYLRASNLVLTEVGDGDGHFEAGESIELALTVRNSGRNATNGLVIGSLATVSPFATAGLGTHNFGVIGSFDEASVAGSSLTLAISASAPSGEVIDFQLQLLEDGATRSIDLQMIAGERRAYVRDDLELDLGWLVGAATDTATTGIWTRTAPTATDFNGDALNPGDDASPGAGTLCFVTGNGRGSAGTDDVDGGSTTLFSPPFDLQDVGVAYVEYSRWWADLSVADDVLLVEVSNDGGLNWLEVETVVATQNSWTQVEFRLNDIIAFTSNMQLRFIATDGGTGSLVEAGIDELKLHIYDVDPRVTVYGTQAINTPVNINVLGQNGDGYALLLSPGTNDFPLTGITGNFLLDPFNFFVPFQGGIPANGLRERLIGIPNDGALIGATIYWQALVSGTSETWLTNRESMTFE